MPHLPVGSLPVPRQDVQTRKGKHWNEDNQNDTAHANDRDGNGLRDREHAGRPGTGPIRNGGGCDHHPNGADGNSLAGHTFNVYQIGTYTDQILNGTQISSLGVRGTASNAWAADAIGIANAYDPSTADDIAKVYGYDDAGQHRQHQDGLPRPEQLRNISKALSESSRSPAAIQGGANLT